MHVCAQPGARIPSLSARRAWIEIHLHDRDAVGYGVALRKESVDRNTPPRVELVAAGSVALRKESVDRNIGHCSTPLL